MTEETAILKCAICEEDSNATPLIPLSYQGATIHLCPRHLPHLIHEPAELIGKLPGAENLKPSDYQH